MFIRKNAVFIDVDISAAHTRIARYLLNDQESDLDQCLSDTEFWTKEINFYKPYLTSIDLPDNFINKILKVGLYTSLNGGNPSSNERLLSNLGLNATDYIFENHLTDKDSLVNSIFFIKVG